MKSPRIVLLDIDGCLKPPAPEPISVEVLGELRSYNRRLRRRSRHNAITLVSGRPAGELRLLSGLIESQIPSIAENGAVLVPPNFESCIVDRRVTAEALRDLAEIKSALLGTLIDRARVRVRGGRESSLTLCPTDVDDVDKVKGICREFIEEHHLGLHCLSSRNCVDVLPRDIDKGTGVLALANHLDLSLMDAAGIGDSSGDLPFLVKLGFSGCPQNAADSVKDSVQLVSEYDYAAGVLDILYQWFNQGEGQDEPS